jgi:hypothetical protein
MCRKGGLDMDTTIVIRVVAGVLALVVLSVIIYRRKKAA